MIAKHLTLITLCFVLCAVHAKSQTPAVHIPELTGNINDLETLFTDAQKSQLDSACTIFAYQTNIPIAIVTFGQANTTKENTDAFEAGADSVLYATRSTGTDMAIFLSKEFRVLGLKANAPLNGDSTKYNAWKAKMQQAFSVSVQPYIPLLKDGKYPEALMATMTDLAAAIKKDF